MGDFADDVSRSDAADLLVFDSFKEKSAGWSEDGVRLEMVDEDAGIHEHVGAGGQVGVWVLFVVVDVGDLASADQEALGGDGRSSTALAETCFPLSEDQRGGKFPNLPFVSPSRQSTS